MMMNGHHHPYIQAAIDGEVARLASAQPGERNVTLFRSAVALASFQLREGEIIGHLKAVAESIGLRGSEFYSTVKSAVKTGHSNPRSVPANGADGLASVLSRATPVQLPPRQETSGAGTGPKFIPAGDEGVAKLHDEERRHVYRRGKAPVRIKIKRQGGAYSNWYRVVGEDGQGWQAEKPRGYVPCPYTGAFATFDADGGHDQLYWPEGEKDVDTLSAYGLPSFTFGGAGDGLPAGIDEYLCGRAIVVLADNDISGQAHAVKKAERAHLAGAASVRLIQFPELPPKGDVSDYLAGASVASLLSRVQETAPAVPKHSGRPANWKDAVISASDLKQKVFKPVRYLVPGYISEGVTIFAGKPKVGKSWLLYDVCVACAGDRFTLGDIKPSQGDVLYLALEDSQRRLKKRLEKLCPIGSWPGRLTLATQWKRADEGGLRDIEEWCSSVQQPVLIVVDTLEKFRPGAKFNTQQYSVDYAAITGLHNIAHERGVAIVVVHHVRKMEAEDPFDMVSGTNGLTGAADTILVLRKQSGNVTLHARGRDIEEKETACAFNKESCRWRLLGEAEAVHSSGERAAIIEALGIAESGQMQVSEIMVATGRRDRNAIDQLLFKMHRDKKVVRIKRGVYGLPGKIDKKERNDGDPAEE
jgi:hypothetical protein